MAFKNAFRILTDNFNKVYKLLLYRFVVILFTGAIFLAFFLPNFSSFINEMFEGAVWENVMSLLSVFLRSLISSEEGSEEIAEGVIKVGSAFSELLASHSVSIVFTVIGTVLVLFAYQFLRGIGDFVIGDMINTRMGSYAEISFFSSLVKNIGIACRFLIIYVPLVMLFDFIIILLCYFVFFFMLAFLPGVVAAFLSVATILCTQAVKHTITSNLMPCMIEGGMGIKDAVRTSFDFKKIHFKRLFSNYIVFVYISVTVCVMAGIATLGSGLLLGLQVMSLWLTAIRFVNYYTYNGRRYFISYDTIVQNSERGETDKFFDSNEMYDKTKTI